MIRRNFATFLAAAALTLPLSAQDADWDSVQRLAPGTEVRVHLTARTSAQGQLQSATDSSLVLDLKNGQQMFSRQEIVKVSVKKKGHRGRNALIGLGVGTGVAVWVAKSCDGGPCEGPAAGAAALTALLLGPAIGAALPTGGWRDVYRAR